MRFDNIVVLVATALLTCLDGVSPSTVSGTIEHDISIATPSDADNVYGASAIKRMLRTYEVPGENNEERGFGFGGGGNVDTWLSRNKPASYVLGKLKLDKGVDQALANPQLHKLNTYVSMLKEKHPSSEVSLLGTLIAHYGEGGVAKALISAQEVDSARELATQLQWEQFQSWLYNSRSGDDVFELLGIRGMGARSMNSRALATLNQYIEQFNYNYPHAAKESFAVLRDGFGEARFARVLAMARQQPDSLAMANTAKSYERELFSSWFGLGEENRQPMQIFHNLFGGGSFAQADNDVRLAINHYNAFYKRAMRGE